MLGAKAKDWFNLRMDVPRKGYKSLCFSFAISPEKSSCSSSWRKTQGSTFWVKRQKTCSHELWEMILWVSFQRFLECKALLARTLLFWAWIGCTEVDAIFWHPFLLLQTRDKFYIQTRDRGRGEQRKSIFHASAILSFWLVSLIQKLCVLFSRLVRHICELCTLSASPSSREIHAFSCKMSSLPLIPFQFIPFCLTGSKWPVQWGDPWWPDGSQLFLSRWIFHMLLCVPQLWVSRWEMLLHPLRGWCYPHLQPNRM